MKIKRTAEYYSVSQDDSRHLTPHSDMIGEVSPHPPPEARTMPITSQTHDTLWLGVDRKIILWFF